MLGAGVHDALVIGISVLIITCPCALALAVPAVQAMASGAFFRAGLFLNDATGIEKLGEVDTVIFDKTGTLTLPEPRVANAGDVPRDLLDVAARLAHSSSHPLARAVARSTRAAPPLPDARETPGMGVAAPFEDGEAWLGSAAFCEIESPGPDADASAIFVRHGERFARLLIRQTLRPDAARVLAHLRENGCKTRHSVRRPAGGGRADRARPRHRKLERRPEAGGQDRLHRRARRGRRQNPHGRRRAE